MHIEKLAVIDELAWGLVETIQNAGKLTQYRTYINGGRLNLAACELTDGGATAIGSAIAKNRVLIVSEVIFYIVNSD